MCLELHDPMVGLGTFLDLHMPQLLHIFKWFFFFFFFFEPIQMGLSELICVLIQDNEKCCT